MVPYPTTPEEIKSAEAELLGSLLLLPTEGIPTALEAEDFTESTHRLIYEALQTVSGAAELDTVRAVVMLLTVDELEHIGGETYLTTLRQQAESTTMSIEEQVSRLKQASLHNLLMQIGDALSTHTQYYDGDDLVHLIGELERALRITRHLFAPQKAPPSHMAPLQTDLDSYLTDLDTRLKQRIPFTGIPTGFVDLDTITGGLQRSNLIIIAGPPSSGKTSFALSIALHILLKEHRSVGMFSLEAPKKQVIERLLSMESFLDQRLLRSLELDVSDRARLTEASAVLSQASLWIDDTANLSTTQLQEKARHLVERCGVELLIVDYVHLMLSSINDKRHENRVQEIGEISRSLKALARELTIPVLALAQLSRAFEGRAIRKFQLSDLRDGSLENDADLVLFLTLAEIEASGTTASPMLATISIAKHRNGPRADLDVCFQPALTRFSDLPTLVQPEAYEQPSLSVPPGSVQPLRTFPRLNDILEQAIQNTPDRSSQ